MKQYPTRIALNKQVLLNLGCGWRYHKEWNNLDFEPLGEDVIGYNIIKGLPYADGVFDVVYSAHFLEHLTPDEAKVVLAECLRVLKKGGLLRLVVPDLEYSAHLYLDVLQDVRREKTAKAQEHYEWASLNLIDQLVRSGPGGQLMHFLKKGHVDPEFIRNTVAGPEYDAFQKEKQRQEANPKPTVKRRIKNLLRKTLHMIVPSKALFAYKVTRFQSSGELHRWMYDSHSLTQLLQRIGFTQIKIVDANTSGIAGFKEYGLDVDTNGVVQKPNSLFMEAQK